MDENLTGILTDEYTDIFAVNPANASTIETRKSILDLMRDDINGNPKLTLGFISPIWRFRTAMLADFADATIPLECQSVSWAPLDLNNDGVNDKGQTSGITVNYYDEGEVPDPVRDGGVTAGGTAGDQSWDRSERIVQSANRNTKFLERNLGIVLYYPLPKQAIRLGVGDLKQ